MLRRITTARLAFQHSPEREQRLVMFARDGDTGVNPEGQEQLEGTEGGRGQAERGRDINNVDVIRSSTAQQVFAASPQQFIDQLKEQGGALDVLIGCAALEDELGKLNIRGDSLKPTEEPEAIEKLFGSLDDEKILTATQTIRRELEEHEKLTARIEHNLKRIYRFDVDVTELEKALDQMYRYENKYEGRGILAAIEREDINEENVAKVLKMKGTFKHEDRKMILESLKDIVRTNHTRREYGQKPDTPGDEKARRAARDAFDETLDMTARTMGDYLDARINAKAGELLAKVDPLFAGFDREDALERFGVTVDGIQDAFKDVVISLKHIRRDIAECRVSIHHENGLNEAMEALEKIAELEKKITTNGRDGLPLLLTEKAVEEHNAIDWAQETGKRLKTIDIAAIQKINPGAAEKMAEYVRFFQPFAPGNIPTEDTLSAIRRTRCDEQLCITENIRRIEEDPSSYSLELIDEIDEWTPDDQIDAVSKATRVRLRTVIPKILRKIDHPTARVLKLEDGIHILEKQIDIDLRTRNGNRVAIASKTARRLEVCNQRLDLLFGGNLVEKLSSAEYAHLIGNDSYGSYSYDNGHICVNRDALGKGPKPVTLQEVIQHELGHAIVDTFRRTGVFPNILLKVHEGLKNSRTNSGDTFETLLYKQALVWGIEIGNPTAPTVEERWKVMDELVNRYALWKDDGKPAATSETERELFTLFDERRGTAGDEPLELTGYAYMNRVATDDLADDAGGDSPPPSPEDEGKVYEETEIRKLEKAVEDIDAFLKAYPEYKNDFDSLLQYSATKAMAEQARADFRSGAYVLKPDFYNNLKSAKKILVETIIDKVITDIDRDKIDLTYASKTGSRSLWRIVTEDAQWVSIYDMMAMVKDAGSDIARMWKRRGESARNKLGKGITEMISDRVPYFGRLKHEYERRDRESEQDEVSVWEKGLEQIDPHELQRHFIPNVKNPDQLKAIINLLTKKGRLDWDDDGLWTQLENFSGYRMPRKACKRDSRLRNQWLQKMIADIWRNKDVYEHWKTENDGAIETGRKRLDNYVQDLSATSSLGTELRKLLFNFTKRKKNLPISPEEEVNPHLYEGIIFYAMRAGKMSMEEKFFYLVKGVEIGLISIDRLRAFSGETFGILNTFPFIDFFNNNQNCTTHEIKKISRQITETQEGRQYSPGTRMTKFLLEVVAFDKNVYDRVNKGLKGAEKIDHEDIPMTITQIDYTGVQQIINYTSGSQAKVSAAAMMNGYVGYNSFLKYFGMKAAIGHPPISTRDIDKIASTLGAYMTWDNTITRHSLGRTTLNDQTPRLSWEQINNQAPVSGRHMTREYRDAMNELMVRLCHALEITQVNKIDIDDYIGGERNVNTADNLLVKYGEGGRNIVQKKEEIYELINIGTAGFVDQLSTKLSSSAGKEALKSVLIDMQEKLIPESDDFTLDKVRPIWDNGNGYASAAA